MRKFPATLLVVCIVVGLARADSAPSSVGKKVAPFALKDAHGKVVSLDHFQNAKAVVVIFAGTECPINNAYMPRLAELAKEYSAKGVQFVALNANVQDTLERMAAHAKKNELPFPVLKDAANRVADAFGARRTPEAFVLDGDRVIRYQGRIDDQYGIGYSRSKPTRRDLVEALDAVLAGKAVAQATTPVAGCLIARVRESKPTGDITFAKHVSRILQNNCQECHRPGQIGPMPLISYDDAVSWADTIREVLDDGRMPPWYADPKHGKFSNDRRLDPQDKANLVAWLNSGTPKGDDKDLPPPVHFAEGWRIGEPDLVLSMEKEFEVPAEMPERGIPYQRIPVETNFTEDKYVVRAEARAGALPVVHHIVIFIVPPGADFAPGRGQAPVLCGTAPGDMPLILPPGSAKKIPAGSKLIFEMHYTPNGVAMKDRSSVGLVFAKEPPKKNVYSIANGNPRFAIPAGADSHQVESSFTCPSNAEILSFMPHMHLRGKDFMYEAIYPDGKKETLLSVPRYNFNWQSVYRLEQPLKVPEGTKIHCVAHFDNSEKNLNNPDPTKTVYWGDQTWQEMMIGWMDASFEKPLVRTRPAPPEKSEKKDAPGENVEKKAPVEKK